MTRRTRLFLFAALAVLAVGLAAWLFAPPEPTAITVANADRIRNGMTLAEVETLLGGPARNESEVPNNGIMITRAADDPCWVSTRIVVIVSFDDNGRVDNHGVFPLHQNRFFDTIRRWLEL
jgi:hypothetical protein